MPLYDAWGWEQLVPWLDLRRQLPVRSLLCVINGTTRGRHWSPAITSVYPQGIDSGEIIETVQATRTDAARQRITAALSDLRGAAHRAMRHSPA